MLPSNNGAPNRPFSFQFKTTLECVRPAPVIQIEKDTHTNTSGTGLQQHGSEVVRDIRNSNTHYH